MEVITYPFIGKVKLFQPSGYSDEYDYEKPSIEVIGIKELTHQFIHSQLFFGVKEGKGLKYVYVSSDYYLYRKIFQVKVQDIANLFISVSENHVFEVESYMDLKDGKIKTICN